MTSCLSGGGRAAYGFDLEIVKSSSSTSTTTTRTSSHNTPSPSSTLSESNSPRTISTRKPRTARKRPNQTYNEAAALLSTAYPSIFSTKSITAKINSSNSQPRNFFGINQHQTIDFDETSDLLFPFTRTTDEVSSDFFFHPPIESKTDMFFEHKAANSVEKRITGFEIDGSDNHLLESLDDFDAESILDEEIEGIDSIMGAAGSNGEEKIRYPVNYAAQSYQGNFGPLMMNSWYGHSIGMGFGRNLGTAYGLRSALRHTDDANWWRYPIVDFDQISPRFRDTTISHHNNEGEGKKSVAEDDGIVKKKVGSPSKKKIKKKKVVAEKTPGDAKGCPDHDPDSDVNPGEVEGKSGLLLKLNCEAVLEAWSDKASPFCDEILGSDAAGGGADIHARLAQIDLFAEGGVREASVLRYREKRRTRLFSKKIRYEVRKVNADQRPRMKGRFVRRPTATNTGGGGRR